MSDKDARWSDEKLESFYSEFTQHVKKEELEQAQQQEMYDAIFRKGDPSMNVTPGIVQLMVQTSSRVERLCIAADRQRTFIGGAIAAIAAIWFFFTDIGPMVVSWLKGVR